MELRQLRYFKAVAEELHFQRAARRVNITQPSLSQQIKKLEEGLDVVLFDRDRKNVKLTEAGEVFLQGANEILQAVDKAVDATKSAAGQEKKTLKIGTRFYIGLPLFSQTVIATKEADPSIGIEQIDMPTNEVPDAVKEATIDIGFTPANISHSALIVKKIVQGYFTVVMPKTHIMANFKNIPITDLKDHPLIFFDKSLNPKLYDQCVGYFEMAGITPKIVMGTNQVQSGLRMAADGYGLFFAANYVVEPLPSDLVAKKITGFDNNIEIVAVWREDNKSKALQTYLQALRQGLTT